MLDQIQGLHHVTAMARDANANNAFFTGALGLRRVKKTVNFDAPDVYHLYYGNEMGAPGTAMTYFPFPNIARGKPGAGETATTVFAVPEGALPFWSRRLAGHGVEALQEERAFGAERLVFKGPDGDGLAIVEAPEDKRQGWTGGEVGAEAAIKGFFGVALRLADIGATAEILRFMGYTEAGRDGKVTRMRRQCGNGADTVDLIADPGAPPARQGAGSVHHIAFAVATRDDQAAARQALVEVGLGVTPPIDRDYFWSIYFRTPGGVLFEVATNEPGFARDEDPAHLGEALKLPRQHEHLRPWLESHLAPIAA